MNVQAKTKGKVLRVLDVASPGDKLLLNGYPRYWSQKDPVDEIAIKSIQSEDVKEPTQRRRGIILTRTQGKIPDAFCLEQDNGYDHVHLHMLESERNIGYGIAKKIFTDIARLLDENGILFFSMDRAFFGPGKPEMYEGQARHAGYLKVVEKILTEQFQIYYSFCELNKVRDNHWRGKNRKQAENIARLNDGVAAITTAKADEIAALFSFPGGLQIPGEKSHFQNCDSLYSFFSGYTPQMEYFVMAGKK